MAILKPFECTVEVDGVAVEEYDDDDTEQANTTTSLTKYIKVVSGTDFSIQFTVQPGWTMHADYISWDISLDGKLEVGGVVRSEWYNGLNTVKVRMVGITSKSGEHWVQRNFKFADITIGDGPLDVEPEDLKRWYAGLGNISVEIWRRKYLNVDNELGEYSRDELGTVPEKALKGQALAVSTGLGPTKRVDSRPKILGGLKTEPFPVATFRFKYRTCGKQAKWKSPQLYPPPDRPVVEALKQLLIIPRSPSPMPLEERDPEDLTPEEARELVRQQRARLAQIRTVKTEEKTSNKRGRTSTIGPVRPTKVVRTASGDSSLELDDSSDDAQIVKVESIAARKSKALADIEVIDLLD